MLTCKQCNYENESERIYCHSCGAKLDRSVLPPQKKAGESLSHQQKRVLKLTTPTRGFFGGWAKTLVNTLLWSVLAACAIQAARLPDGVPPLPKMGTLEETPPIAMQLEEANALPRPQQINIPEAVANSYLRRSVKGHAQGPLSKWITFERAFVNFSETGCRISTEQTAWGYPLYAGALYHLAIRDGKLAATNAGGNLGRLPVHPMLMRFSDLIFKKLWDALPRERKLLDGMREVEVKNGSIAIITKGSTAPPPAQ